MHFLLPPVTMGVTKLTKTDICYNFIPLQMLSETGRNLKKNNVLKMYVVSIGKGHF